MAAQSNLELVITAKDEASKSVKGLTATLENLQPTFKKMAAIGTVAFGAITAEMVVAVKAAGESDKALAQLNAVLKSTSGVAGVTADEVTRLSQALQKQSTYDDEAITGAQSLLLTFTKIGKDIFPDATKIVLDMSTALGQDLKSSAIQVGKALQDPILGVSALRRVGVNFNEAQQEVIKNLVNTGKAAEAQALIMKELSTEFGGSAAAQAATFAGQLEILKNRFGDLQEGIGAAIIPLLNKLLAVVAPVLEKMIAWAEENPRVVQTILAISLVTTALIAILGFMGLALVAVNSGLAAMGVIIGIITSPITLFVIAVLAVIAACYLLAVVIKTNWDKIKAWTLEIWGAITQFFLDSWIKIQVAATTVWDNIAKAFKSAFEGIRSFFKEVINWVIDAFERTVNAIISGLNAVGNRLKLPSIPNVSLPRLAKGGIVNSPTTAVIGEAGPEAVIPLSRGMAGAGIGGVTINIGTLIGGGMDQDDFATWMGDALINMLKKQTRI